MKPDEIGLLLKVAREDCGRSLADAASVTKISKCYLLNMEKGDFSALGARPYAIGYIKTYAKYLGLDDKHFSEMLRDQYP